MKTFEVRIVDKETEEVVSSYSYNRQEHAKAARNSISKHLDPKYMIEEVALPEKEEESNMIEEQIYMNVVAAMSEPHRKYHTMRHLGEMFMLAHLRGIKLKDEQIYAICLHDVVYRVPAEPEESNEVASAKLAMQWLSNDFDPTFVDSVCKIILDTEKELPTTMLSSVVIDLDLAGLGLGYWENRVLIREEFGHVPDAAFFEGRLKWLKSMLERQSIFVSGHFEDLETAAVKNIESEIQMIESSESRYGNPSEEGE